MFTKISEDIIKEIKEVEITYSIKQLQDRKAVLLIEKEQYNSHIDKEISDIDKTLTECIKAK